MPAIIKVVDGRTIIKVGENTALASKYATLAEQFANAAGVSADAVEIAAAAVGVYTTVGAGESATTNGQSFYVASGGDVTLYLNNAGTGDEVASIVTTAKLASTAPGEGASLVAFVQDGVDAVAQTAEQKMRERVSILDFGGVGDGVTSNDDAGAKALTYLASRGGGTLYFPTGDYPIKLLIDSPNITILTEPGTVLRASGASTIIDITANGVNATVDGPVVTGQTLADESIINTGGVKNTSAAYGIRTYAKGTTLRNIKAKACRFDPLYIRVDGEANFIAENFELGPSARNAASIITGHRFNFSKGIMRQSNEYSDGTADGLYMFDHEPNIATDTFDTIEFNDVGFINEGTTADNWQVMFHTTNLDRNVLNAVFERCVFKKAGVATTAAQIRLAAPETTIFRGLTVRDSSFEDRIISIAGGAVQRVEDSLFENIDLLGTGSVPFGISFGTGSTFRDVRCAIEPVIITETTPNTIVRQSVTGLGDQSPKDLAAGRISSLAGPLEVGNTRIDVKNISVTDTVNFVDLVQLGIRATFKITIGGADASGGINAAHASESWCIVSNDVAHKPAIITIFNQAGAGLDVQWKDAGNGTGIDRRTLQVRPQSATANQYVVKIETLALSLISGSVTWLV